MDSTEPSAHPFDDDGAFYAVLINNEDQYSLWPEPIPTPRGWTIAHSRDTRSACLEYIEARWTDMRPRSLQIAGEAQGGIAVGAITPGNAAAPSTDEERRQLRHCWKGAEHEVVHATLPELFERQARATPLAEALVFEDNRLTYQELQRRVGRLANRLASLAAGPGEIVAILLPRGSDFVVTLLAVLKSGAAYLPLDVEHPPSRLEYMVCVVGTPDLARTHGGLSGKLVVLGCGTGTAGEGEHVDKPEPTSGRTPHPLDAAYVMYTSGSTGAPKGVVIPHLSIVNHLKWMQHEYGLAPEDRVLQKTPVGFDVSVWEFFWPLITGATVVVAGPALHREPAAVAALIQRERVTTAHFVPSMLRLFLDEPSARSCDTIRRVFTSGEELPTTVCTRFFDILDCSLHNLYGPTEAAIDVTAWTAPGPPGDIRIPIGTPVFNTQVHVLDDELRPVSPGTEGELYLMGIQLARCYLRNPVLTAERFVASPFGTGERMYRTGDRCRWNRRGELEYLGRTDAQFKINGVRIESGEVEAVLARHPAVGQAAVVAAETAAGGHFMAAYVTVDADRAPMLARLVRLANQPEAGGLKIEYMAPDLPVCLRNAAETRFIYREIFEEKVYTRDGITLGDGCIFDVGANIGLFTLFAARQAPNARIYAFEPVPETFDVLRANVELHGVDVVLLPCAVAATDADQADFTYYPRVSLMSGRYADADADAAMLRSFTAGEFHGADSASDDEDELAAIIAERLESRQVKVPVTTISGVVDKYSIMRVSLLKIDVEKSETDVLAGIRDEHWGLIDQIVLEVHDLNGRLGTVRELLLRHGFEVVSRSESGSGLRGLHTVSAVRPHVRSGRLPSSCLGREHGNGPFSVEDLVDAVRADAATQLPSAMLPASISVVPSLPLTGNGKLDRRTLATRAAQPERPVGRPPRSEQERVLCELVASVVGVRDVSIDDDFFAIGGSSLSAIELTASISRRFGISFKLRTVLRHPVVGDLAVQVVEAVDRNTT
jgi:amino acid adenylation domain-containing protein/FkbM family methyltransferase